MLGGDVLLKFPEAKRTQEGGSKLTKEHESEEVRGYCILLRNFCDISISLAFKHVFLSLFLSRTIYFLCFRDLLSAFSSTRIYMHVFGSV